MSNLLKERLGGLAIKLIEIITSSKFIGLTGTALSAWLADISTNGFQLDRLLFIISGWLTAVTAVGWTESIALKLSSKKEEK